MTGCLLYCRIRAFEGDLVEFETAGHGPAPLRGCRRLDVSWRRHVPGGSKIRGTQLPIRSRSCRSTTPTEVQLNADGTRHADERADDKAGTSQPVRPHDDLLLQSVQGERMILINDERLPSDIKRNLRRHLRQKIAVHPKVKQNASTPESRNSISNLRPAIGFACRIN